MTTKKLSSSFVHLDIDYFFAQVEELRLGIKDKPIGVQQHMEIASVNYVARSYGLYNRISVAKAISLCPKIVLVRGDVEVNGMQRYRTKSQEVLKCIMRALDAWTGTDDDIKIPKRWCDRRVEKASIDDFFIELPCDTLTAEKWAERLRENVKCTTGLETSAGVARTKLLSMLATKRAKPNGIHRCDCTIDESILLEESKIKNLCGAGIKGIPKIVRSQLSEILGDQATVKDLRDWRSSDELGAKLALGHEGIKCVNYLLKYGCDGSEMSLFSFPRSISVECSVRRNETSPAITVAHVAEGYERLAPMLLSRHMEDEKILGVKRKIDKLVVKWKLFPGAKTVRQVQVPWPAEMASEHNSYKQNHHNGLNGSFLAKSIAKLAARTFDNANSCKSFRISRVVLVLNYKKDDSRSNSSMAQFSVVRKERGGRKNAFMTDDSKQKKISDMFQIKKRPKI